MALINWEVPVQGRTMAAYLEVVKLIRLGQLKVPSFGLNSNLVIIRLGQGRKTQHTVHYRVINLSLLFTY